MPRIKVQVREKIALNITPEVKIVCGNDDYEIEFDFDGEWDSVKFKTGLFIYNGGFIPQPFSGNVCPVPIIKNTTLLAIGVKSSDGILYTTTPTYASCLKSVDDFTTTEIPAPTQDIYDEIVAMINAGMLKGDKGDKGDKGVQGEQGEKGATGAKLVSLEKVSESIDSVVYEMTFDDGTVFPFIIPKGAKGDKGDKGEKGDKGDAGAKIVSTDFVGEDENGGNIYEQTFDNGTTAMFTAPKGEKGDEGEKGDKGEKGAKGDRGERGIQGIQGERGADGKDGKNGYTPVRGIDYWTKVDIDYSVKEGITNNEDMLTDKEKDDACAWLGADRVPLLSVDEASVIVYLMTPDGAIGKQPFSFSRDADWSTRGEAIILRHNDGTLYVGDPYKEYHAVNKKYLDKKLGEIDTLLDEIIALQEALIGGGSV